MDMKSKSPVKDWLSKSESDLVSADLLFDHKLYSQALYFLQQGNEKLAKGLLIWIGFLTPKMAKRDWRVKAYLGFQPKEPMSYGHRTMRAMLSDMEKAAPIIESYLQMLQHKNWRQTTIDFQKTIRKSRKGIQKLKKKPFAIIETEEQLANEVKAAQEIFSRINLTMNEVKKKLDTLDYEEIKRVALEIAERKKFDLSKIDQIPPFQEVSREHHGSFAFISAHGTCSGDNFVP